jgi:hypothetical protein
MFLQISHISMDWFKGKSTGNRGCYHQLDVFPVKKISQSIENRPRLAPLAFAVQAAKSGAQKSPELPA